MTKQKNLITLFVLTLVLTTIGLGASIIYSDYLYNPTDGFVSFSVMDASNMYPEPGTENVAVSSDENAERVMQSVEAWASNNDVTVLYKNGYIAGCGYSSHSSWLNDNLSFEKPQTADLNGVLVSGDPRVQSAYVRDGILLPGSAGLEIISTYKISNLPPVLVGVDFLYPINISASVEGMYFVDTNEIAELSELFENNGYIVTDMRGTYSVTATSVLELAKRLVTDSFLSRAVTFAMIGLVFCFIYNVLVLYRDNKRQLRIHHLFGLSRRNILLGVSVISAAMVLAAVLLFRIIIMSGLTYMPVTDLNHITQGVLVIYIFLAALVNVIGYTKLMKQL